MTGTTDITPTTDVIEFQPYAAKARMAALDDEAQEQWAPETPIAEIQYHLIGMYTYIMIPTVNMLGQVDYDFGLSEDLRKWSLTAYRLMTDCCGPASITHFVAPFWSCENGEEFDFSAIDRKLNDQEKALDEVIHAFTNVFGWLSFGLCDPLSDLVYDKMKAGTATPEDCMKKIIVDQISDYVRFTNGPGTRYFQAVRLAEFPNGSQQDYGTGDPMHDAECRARGLPADTSAIDLRAIHEVERLQSPPDRPFRTKA